MHEFGVMVCPTCSHHFGHQIDLPNVMTLLNKVYGTHQAMQEKQEKIIKRIIRILKSNQLEIQIPVDATNTKFTWQKKAKKNIHPSILGFAQQKVKTLPFQQKQYWFRSKIETLRIPWIQGADYIKLDKTNVLIGSLNEVMKVDMHKQVKVQFIGQKVNDAGGLLRQWVHMVIKQIFDYNTGIFIFANTDDTMYSLKWDEDMEELFSTQLLFLLGIIIGKAIFQRIPLTCFLDRTILRQITQSHVKLQDIYGFDKQLYKNWKMCLDAQNIDDLDVYFVTYKNDGGDIKQHQLLQGHKDVKVDDSNKKLYIDLSIEKHATLHVQRSIKNIIKGISRVFPPELLQIFQPYQMEMIMYGVPFIDLQDWLDNTLYKQPYNKNHKVIKWFWAVMDEFDQQQLGKVLHFCTGSTRTPIHGFSRLESNRGNYSKFLIVPTEYHKKNPFPKAHTCFNRLELPEYPNMQILRTYLTAISKNQLDGIFGLD